MCIHEPSSRSNYTYFFDRIDFIVIASDINISYDKYHINAASTDDLDLSDESTLSKQDLVHLVKTRPSLVRKITNYHALVNLMDLVNGSGLKYEFTEKQLDVLNENPTKLIAIPITLKDIDRILHMIRECNLISIPDINMTKPNCKGILESLNRYELRSITHPHDLNRKEHYLNHVFEFVHKGNTDIYIKLVFDYAKDVVVAVIAFHDYIQNSNT